MFRRAYHELEIQENGCERHEVKSDRAERDSPNFIHESANPDFPRGVYHWFVSSMDLNWELFVFTLVHERGISEWVEVNTWNSCNRSKRNVPYNNLENIWKTRQNDHDVDLNNDCYDSAKDTDSKRHIGIAEHLVVVDGVLHQDNAHFDILLYVDMHHHRGYESSDHHEEIVWRGDQVPLLKSIVVVLKLKFPHTTQHTNLNQLDDQSILKNVRFLLGREIHFENFFVDKDSISQSIWVIVKFEFLHFRLVCLVNTIFSFLYSWESSS